MTSPEPKISVYDSPEDLAAAAARDFSDRAAESISERGRFVVALAGGSTPKATYELLARDYRESVDWPNVHVFFGDERTVPADDDDSNFKMANDALLSHVPVGSVHRMKGELNPALSAAMYGEDVQEFFGAGATVVFDLVQLGIGDDGHTASLFPHTDALDVTEGIAVANEVPQKDTVRLTLTKATINDAREVCFLVAGAGKADALYNVLQTDADPHEYPSKMIQPENGPVWMLDGEAAGRLDLD